MSKAEEESPQEDVGEKIENQCGVILGYWDHEKTPALIQDLEYSVNLVGRKCKKLLEELIQYKKYVEISGEPDFHLSFFQRKNKKTKNSQHFSGSDPDIAFRKNMINFQKIQQVFEEKFEERLININKELTEAAHKIGLKNNIILFPANEYQKTMKEQTKGEEEPNIDATWCKVFENFQDQNILKAKTKSDSLIIENNKMSEFSKITKNELELYQKLSRLRIKRKKKKKKLKGRKMATFKGRSTKLLGVKKTSKCGRGLAEDNVESEYPKIRRKKFKKRVKETPQKEKEENRSAHEIHSREKLNELEIRKVCKSLAEGAGKNLRKSGAESVGCETKDEGGSNLRAAIRRVIPFTTCTSTSRSYNLGLNIQQLISLSKHRGKIRLRTSASEKMNENTKAVVFQETPPSLEKRKLRSKYTGSSAGGFLGYHKSTMSEYTNGRKSMIKSESKTAYAVGSRIMVSNCQRTDIFEFGKNKNWFENASGDGSCNERCVKLSLEWKKVYNSFLSIYKKYTSLKEKISGNTLVLAREELKSLENEIDYSIEKYKDFLRFYSKFLQLSHRLKSLKIACETEMLEPVTSFYSDCQEKMSTYRPTSSMTMKKAFREVQALQDKIKLVSD